jgi:hypothetical protein
MIHPAEHPRMLLAVIRGQSMRLNFDVTMDGLLFGQEEVGQSQKNFM